MTCACAQPGKYCLAKGISRSQLSRANEAEKRSETDGKGEEGDGGDAAAKRVLTLRGDRYSACKLQMRKVRSLQFPPQPSEAISIALGVLERIRCLAGRREQASDIQGDRLTATLCTCGRRQHTLAQERQYCFTGTELSASCRPPRLPCSTRDEEVSLRTGTRKMSKSLLRSRRGPFLAASNERREEMGKRLFTRHKTLEEHQPKNKPSP